MKQSSALALVIALYLLCIAYGKTFFTRYNELCVSECTTTREHGYNWCWTGKSWPNSWDYCSPRENVDRYGRACRSGHSCEQHEGTSYNWCYRDGSNWDYCGKVTNNLKVISSYYGYYCNDDCTQRDGTSYYWCHTQSGWDYCSPEEGKDYKGNRCDVGSYCDKNSGTSYYWCYVNGGSTRSYCSIKGERKYITYRGYYCSTELQYTGTQFGCYRYDGTWEYTSPAQDADSHGRACTDLCTKGEGTDYYWCHYNGNYWDYCGHQSFDNNAQHCHVIGKRQAPSSSNSGQCKVRTVTDRGNNLEVNWYMENNDRMSSKDSDYVKRYKRDANSAIAQLNHIPSLTESQSSGTTLVNEGDVRLDLQQRCPPQNNRYYVNLQIQINRSRNNRPGSPPDSTTVATALIETDENYVPLVPIRYVRDALLRSLNDCNHRQCRLQRHRLPSK